MKIGFTATIPVEYIFAAGHTPVDLNNVFITSDDPKKYVACAEEAGFPQSLCSWVKGIYGVIKSGVVDKVITVVEGDCASNRHLADILAYEGSDVFCFSYPYDRSAGRLAEEMARLSAWLGSDAATCDSVCRDLRRIREKLKTLDEMSYTRFAVTGTENHLWLVSATDFGGDYRVFEQRLDAFLADVRSRPARFRDHIRLGYAGVPPIVSDLYAFTEGKGGIVVFNEVQRQFAMLSPATSLVEQYRHYTYPYTIESRVRDINEQAAARSVRGIIHYVQSFCAHGLDDIMYRDALQVPVLTIECDRPGVLDGKNKTKIEAFLERWL